MLYYYHFLFTTYAISHLLQCDDLSEKWLFGESLYVTVALCDAVEQIYDIIRYVQMEQQDIRKNRKYIG